MIREVENYKQLDELVFEAKNGTIFHSSYWQTLSTKVFAKIGYYQDGYLVGCFIFEIDNLLKKGKLGTIAPYLGIVTSSKLSEKEIDTVELELIKFANQSYESITFFVSPWNVNLKNLLFNGFDAKLSYTNVLDLNCNIETIYDHFDNALKRNIRKARLDELNVVREYTICNLIALVKQSFLRQKATIWFDVLEAEKCVRGLIQNNFAAIFTTYNKNLPIASVCIVWDSTIAYYILGGYDWANKHRGGVSIAMWEAIQFSKLQKKSYFDFEGSRIPNINNFFTQFGTILKPFYQVLKFQDSITIY